MVYTRDATGVAIIYVDCTAQMIGEVGSGLNIWDDSYRLMLANELTGDRPWQGEFHLVSVFDRALSAVEVNQNCNAGPDGNVGSGGNLAPVADAGPDQSVTGGDTVSLDGTASSDSDGTITAYSWLQTAGPMITLSGASTATPGFTAPGATTDTALSFRLTVTDNEGDTGSATVTVTVQGIADTTPPLITASVSPAANTSGWHRTDAIVSFVCADSGSGIATCPAAVTVTSEGAAQVITGTAIDGAGNTASTNVTLNIDKTPPVITSSVNQLPNTAGWNNTDITSTFDCIDSLSDIASCPGLVVTSTEGANQTVTGTATDLAGNVSTDSFILSIDKTAPVIQISEPLEEAVINGSTVVVRGSVTDANTVTSFTIDGVSVVVDGASNFEYTATLPEGSSTLSFQAIDVADNQGLVNLTITGVVNQPPEITSVAVTSASQLVSYAYQVVATDPNQGDLLTYSLMQAPQGMLLDVNTGLISWIPGSTQIGNYDVLVTVADQEGAQDSQSYVVVVQEASADQYVCGNIPTDGSPVDLALSNNGSKILIIDHPPVISSTSQGGIIIADTASRSVIDRTELHIGFPFQITTNRAQSKAYVTISKFAGNTTTTGYSSVEVIDTNTNEVIKSIPFADSAGAIGIVAAKSKDRVYVSARFDDSVYVIDTQTDTIIKKMWVGGLPIGIDISPDDNYVYTYARGNARIHVIDTNTNSVTGFIPLSLPRSSKTTSVAVSPNNKYLFGAIYVSSGIAVVDIDQHSSTRNQEIAVIPTTARGFRDLSISKDGRFLYAISRDNNEILIVDVNPDSPTYLTVIDQFVDGDSPRAIVTGVSQYGFGYVANAASKDITVLCRGSIKDNTPPAIISTPVITAANDISYQYVVSAIDPDIFDELSFNLGESPAGMSIDPLSGVVSWIPTVAQVGSHMVTVVVTDSYGFSDQQTFSIAVALGNQRPQITTTPVQSGTINQLYVYDVDATDIDGDALTFSLDAAPVGMAIEQSSGLIQWVPSLSTQGVHDVSVRVTDPSGLAAIQTYQLTIINQGPQITSTPNNYAVEGVVYNYDVDAFDPDGDAVTYGLVTAPPNMTIDAVTGLVSWLPTSTDLGSQNIIVSASDAVGATQQQPFTVLVSAQLTGYTLPEGFVASTCHDADGGQLMEPVSLLFDNNRDIFVTNSGSLYTTTTPTLSGSLLKIDSLGNQTIVAGGSLFKGPNDLAISAGGAFGYKGDIFVSMEDYNEGNSVADDLLVRVPMMGGSPVAFSSLGNETAGVRFPPVGGAYGDVFFMTGRTTYNGSMALYKVDAQGVKTKFPIYDADGEFDGMFRLGFGNGGAFGNDLYVRVFADPNSTIPRNLNAILRVSPSGESTILATDVAGKGFDFSPDHRGPYGENIYIASSGSVYKISASGTLESFASGFQDARDVTFAPDGSLCVLDSLAKRIVRIFPSQANNNLPLIISTPSSITYQGATYYYPVKAFDSNGDALTFSLDEAPQGMQIDSVTGDILWSSTSSQLGQHLITVRVTDGSGLFDTQTYVLQVSVITSNIAPQITSNPPLGNIYEGVNFTYDVDAIDADPQDNNLYYSLSVSPDGMSIDVVTGIINWTTSNQDIGIHNVTVKVDDPRGGTASQSFSVVVDAITTNVNPTITSAPIQTVTENQLYTYTVEAVDADGDALIYSLTTAPVGMTIDSSSGLISWTTAVGLAGTYSVVVQVDDSRGGVVSQSFSVAVNVAGSNIAPAITSTPTQSVTENQLYTYAVEATDANGDILVYSLAISPVEMTINSSSGLMSWTPAVGQVGTYNIVVQVDDSRGGIVSQSFSVVVNVAVPNVAPTITSAPSFNAKSGFEYQYLVIANDPDGDPLNYSLVLGPAGMVMDNSGLISWTPGSINIGTHNITVRVDDGLAYVNQSWVLTVINGTISVAAILDISPASIYPGETVTISVDAVNVVGDFIRAASVDGVAITLNANGQAGFTSSVFGRHDVVATVSDVSGSATQSASFYVLDPDDVLPPVVNLTSPVNDAVITAPVDITGSVSDANLNEYTLAYAPAGTDNFTVIASGTTSVAESVLALLDSSLMSNGLYTLVLQATDNNGQTASDSVTLKVEGDLKAGNFSFSVTDLEIPMSGIPIRVTRTYDSRRRAEALDFGYGWSLDYQNMKIEESRIPGAGWALNTYSSGPLGLIPLYCVEPLGSPTVFVTLPDGSVESFDVHAAQPCWEATPVLDHTLAFTAQSGTQSTLESISDTSGRLINGNLEFIGSFAPIDPSQYKLTTKAGFVFNLDQSFGITSVVDPNGNTLTYTNDGIFHSDGKSVLFTRDGLGRITDVVDPMGNTIQYQRDSNGDLQSVTDVGNNITEYTYNSNHGLLDIIDPLGRNIVKNIYDTNGRLIAQEDSDGNRTDFNHNIAGRTSTITDRLGRVTIYGYDDRGNVTTQIDALGNATTWTFDADDNQLSKTDPLGNTSTATYNTRRDQLTQTDALNNTVSFTYNQRGQEITITDARGNVFTNSYDLVGNLLSITDPDDNTAGNNIDAKGNVILTQDTLGNSTTYTYDSEGNKLTETDALDNVTTFTYDANNNVLSETRSRTVAGTPVNETTSYVYDSQNRVIQTTDALGDVIATEYDVVGNTTAQIDALGNRTTMEYDAYRRLILTTYADGTTEANTYDVEGNRTSSTDRLGRTTTFTYDALNRQIRTTFADGTVTQTEYDAAGRVIATIDANGNRSESTYDDAGRRSISTNALNQQTTFGYDADGNQLNQTDANSNTMAYTYDDLDRRIQTTYADSSTMLESYDALGRVISKTDQAGITTRYEYDALGRLTAVIDVLNQRTEYTYDEVGNKLTQRDASGNTTSWTYDALGRVLSRTLPEGQSESFAYDAGGNQISHTDFNGNTATFEYDSNNRLTRKVYADASVETYSYDAVGNRTSATNTQGTTSFIYDNQNRLSSETKPDGTVLDYSYDSAGNRTAVITTILTTPTVTTQTTGYSFDVLNRLQTVTDSASQTTTYGYDAVGNRQSIAYPNGNTTTYVYDSLNRLTQVQTQDSTSVVISQFDYTPGATGRRDQVIDISGATTSYSYDDLYRLIGENLTNHPVLGSQSNSYTYDATGNRIYATEAGVSTTYTYDANDRLLTAGGETYSYDANGNTLTKTIDATVVTNGYDQNNRLVSMVKTESAIETDNVSYQYDIDGIRTAKNDDGITTNYVVDKNRDYAQVLNELDSTSNPTVSYVYGDDLIKQNRAANDSYFLYDGLGSTRALTDSTGAITDTYDYSAYGTEIDSTGVTENSYRYTGEQFDANLNQVYLRARYYDPAVGRFTQQDTWMGNNSDPVTLHKYAYGNLDPVNNIDPTGNFSLGGLMSAINIASTLVTTAQTTYSLFQIASGDENAPTAKQIGFEILAGMGAGKLIKIFSKRFRACRVGNSFAEGTLVSTSNGLIPIENIKIGDMVHSFDEQAEKIVEQEVVHLIHGDKKHEMITLNVSSGDSIRATDGHPFYVAANDDKWVSAKDLMLGDSLLGSDGSLISIVDIKSEFVKEKVYNLTVANSHTYYVGGQKLLAHNSTCRIPHRARPRIEQGNDRQGWVHIQRRHFPGGDVSSRQGDLFASGTSQFQIEQAARILVTKGRRTSPVNRPVQTFEKVMVVNGRQARYKVVVDSDDGNRVITIFPMSP